LLYSTKREAEAEPLIRRALAIDEASYGPDHPKVARDLNNLAALLYETNRKDGAKALFRRALVAAMGPTNDEAVANLDEFGRPFGISLSNLIAKNAG
jgi:Tfp pilus assembly protein PilF